MEMQKGQVDYAKRRALELFDAWNNVTGFPEKFTSYYYEISSIIEDAVEIGIMVTFGITPEIKNGELVKKDIDIKTA